MIQAEMLLYYKNDKEIVLNVEDSSSKEIIQEFAKISNRLQSQVWWEHDTSEDNLEERDHHPGQAMISKNEVPASKSSNS